MCLQCLCIQAQDVPISKITIASEVNSAITAGYGQYNITELDYKKKIVGSNYLMEEWQRANLRLRGDTNWLGNVLIRVDITNNLVEIQVEGKPRLVPSLLIEEIQLKEGKQQVFTTRYNIDLFGPVGFYEVLYEENLTLYRHYATKYVESHYNVALDSGSKDHELRVEESYFVRYQERLIKLAPKKAKLLEMFGNNNEITSFFKEKKIKLKSSKDMIQLVKFLNDNFTSLPLKG